MRGALSFFALVPLLSALGGCLAINDYSRFEFDGGSDGGGPTDAQADAPPTDADVGTPPGDFLEGATAVTVGVNHTCAIVEGARLLCWGRNGNGELGQRLPGGAGSASSPLEVPVVGPVHAVSAGQDFTCAIVGDDRHVECWGANDEGQLGDGTRDEHSTPAPVPGVSGARRIASGQTSSCALVEDGTAMCWGANGSGQVGSGSEELEVLIAEPVMGLTGATELSVGGSHSCALKDDMVYCWGSDYCGELGLEDGGERRVATDPVPGLSNVSAVMAGQFSTCAIASGQVYCWGENSQKQTGQSSGEMHPTPQEVDLGSDATGLAGGVGGSVACALSGGQAWCWGEANLLGAGLMDLPNGRASAVMVHELLDATTVAVGWYHGCALRSNGRIDCWGEGTNGQLGIGDNVDHFEPVTVREP